MMALRIEPLPEGGILVSEVPPANGVGGSGYFFPMLFACSDLGDALDFIKGKLAPVEPEGVARCSANSAITCDCAAKGCACVAEA